MERSVATLCKLSHLEAKLVQNPISSRQFTPPKHPACPEVLELFEVTCWSQNGGHRLRYPSEALSDPYSKTGFTFYYMLSYATVLSLEALMSLWLYVPHLIFLSFNTYLLSAYYLHCPKEQWLQDKVSALMELVMEGRVEMGQQHNHGEDRRAEEERAPLYRVLSTGLSDKGHCSRDWNALRMGAMTVFGKEMF